MQHTVIDILYLQSIPLPYMGIDELMRVYNYSGYSGWNNCPCFCSACCCCCCAHVYGIKVCLCLYVYV